MLDGRERAAVAGRAPRAMAKTKIRRLPKRTRPKTPDASRAPMRAPAYVINLDRSPERLRHMHAQAGAIALAFERVEGIDGEQLAEADLAAHRERAAPYPLTPGEIGCWLSHQKAWSLIAARDDAWGLVLEDDVQLSPDLPAALDGAADAPADADIVKIDTSLGVMVEMSRAAVPFAGRSLHRLRRNSWGTAGYLVSRRAAAWLLEHARPVEAPIDLQLFSPQSRLFPSLVTYIATPALVVQEQHQARERGEVGVLGSVITLRQEARRASGPGLPGKVVREIGRVGDQLRMAFAYRRRIDWR
jgi:glycosyl transferase family 25